MRHLLLIAALVGCGPSSGDDEEEFKCERADRSGTYLLHYSERTMGSCGQPPDEVARLDVEGGLAQSCQFTAPDAWSSDECRLDRSIQCCDGGFCTTIIGYTEQQDATGETIVGVLTIRVEEIGASGLVLSSCVSTYDVTASRQ